MLFSENLFNYNIIYLYFIFYKIYYLIELFFIYYHLKF